MTADTLAARLAQVQSATKADIADFVKERYFDNKLKNTNKKVTSNKPKHVETEKKLTDLTNSWKNIKKKK